MPDAMTYTGGCHCGLVRFECTTDLAMVYRLQLLDLHQEGAAFRFRGAEELSAARRRGQSEGISVQQARDPASALRRLRRRSVRARQQVRRQRACVALHTFNWHRRRSTLAAMTPSTGTAVKAAVTRAAHGNR